MILHTLSEAKDYTFDDDEEHKQLKARYILVLNDGELNYLKKLKYPTAIRSGSLTDLIHTRFTRFFKKLM